MKEKINNLETKTEEVSQKQKYKIEKKKMTDSLPTLSLPDFNLIYQNNCLSPLNLPKQIFLVKSLHHTKKQNENKPIGTY